MTPNEYQQLAARTLIDVPNFQITDEEIMISWTAIGLAGEAGECAEHVKKQVFHRVELDPLKMKKELGDVLWYLSALAKQFGFTLEEIMEHNIEKLKARYPDGFSSERSMFREGQAQ